MEHDLPSSLSVFRRAIALMATSIKGEAPSIYRSPAVKGRLYVFPVTVASEGKTIYEEIVGVLKHNGRVVDVLRGPKLFEELLRIYRAGLTVGGGTPVKPPRLGVLKAKRSVSNVIDRSMLRFSALNERLESAGLPSLPSMRGQSLKVDESRLIVIEEEGGEPGGGPPGNPLFSEDPQGQEEKLDIEYELREGRLPEDARRGKPLRRCFP